jgi:hypothetical protein
VLVNPEQKLKGNLTLGLSQYMRGPVTYVAEIEIVGLMTHE